MSPRRAAVGVAALAAIWGLVGVVVRQIDLPALAIVAGRCGFATATIAVTRRIEHQPRVPRPVPQRGLLAVSAVLLAVHWGCLVGAQQRAPIGTVLLITYLAPVLVALLAPLVVGEHVPARTYAAVGIALAGIALLARPEPGEGVGIALAFAAAVTYAILTLFTKRLTRTVEGSALSMLQLGLAGILLLPVVVRAPWGQLAPSGWAWLAVLGVVLTGLVGPPYLRLMKRLPVATVSVLTYVEAVSAVLCGWIFLGERPTTLMLVGGALVVGAGIMVILANAPRPVPETPPVDAPR